ncbi:hypothetical protein MMC10_004404 [Thelotrema lepadinum]|nr:hypothetical protein [Thelotrema lepadinum]
MTSKSYTYRVRKLPHYIDKYETAALLAKFLGLGPDNQVRVWSLVKSLSPWERTSTQVATVTFDSQPQLLQGPKKQWTFDRRLQHLEHDVVVDNHFLEFTPLNDISPENHVAEQEAYLRLCATWFLTKK